MLLFLAAFAALFGGTGKVAPARASATASGAVVDATRGPGLMPVGHFGGSSLAVAATANRVYAGQGPVLAIYEPVGDGDLRLLGESPPLPGLITEIEVAGGLLAVAFDDKTRDANIDSDFVAPGMSGGLALVDVADASRPRIRSLIDDLEALALGLGWDGGGLGDAEGAGAATDIDPMLGPKKAAPLGAVSIAGGGSSTLSVGIRQMVLNLPWLVLATEAGVISLDVSEPAAPRPMGRYSPDGQAAWGLAYGRRLLYANTDAGLEVLEMSDPSRPKRVGCGTSFGLVAARLELARADRAARMLGIEGPSRAPSGRTQARWDAAGGGVGTAPRGSLRSARPDQEGGCQEVFSRSRLELASDKLLVGRFGEILILDLRRPNWPELVGFAFTSSSSTDLEAGTRWLYSLGQDGLLEVLDLSVAADFVLPVGQLDLPGIGALLSVIGSRAYAATSEGGLRVIDLALPQVPREIGALVGAPHPRAIELADGRAYVVDGYSGLQVFDLADPSRPQKLGAYRMPHAQALSLDGGLGYLRAENGNLRAIDLSRPARPRELAALSLPSPVAGMAAAGGLLYLGLQIAPEDGSGQSWPALSVVDASLLAAPRVLMSLDLSPIGGAQWIRLHEGRLYALGRFGLAIFDLADPRVPAALGTYYLPRRNPEVTDLTMAGDRAYLALGSTGLVVVDVSEPRNPVEVGVVPAAGRSMLNLLADADQVFVVDRGAFDFEAPPDRLGISLLDLSLPNRARRLLRREGLAIGSLSRFVDGGIFGGVAESALARSGDYLYLADSRSGVQVFRRFEGPRVYLPALLR